MSLLPVKDYPLMSLLPVKDYPLMSFAPLETMTPFGYFFLCFRDHVKTFSFKFGSNIFSDI